jgi:hypothetical protein
MVLFTLLGVCLVGVAVALNVSWILLNWRRIVPMALGIPFFALLIVGVALNTVFLVREVRRNERHDAFLPSTSTSKPCSAGSSTTPSAASSTPACSPTATGCWPPSSRS